MRNCLLLCPGFHDTIPTYESNTHIKKGIEMEPQIVEVKTTRRSSPVALLEQAPPKGLTPAQRTDWYMQMIRYLEMTAPGLLDGGEDGEHSARSAG